MNQAEPQAEFRPGEPYEHTQSAPLYLPLFLMAALMLTLGWVLRAEPVVRFAFPVMGVFFFILGASFKHLTVADEGDALRVRFGPLPLFSTRIRYAEMDAARAGKISLLDGWGIHYSLRGGWVWNLWGWGCVEIHRSGRVFRVGTDEPDRLAAFLQSRIAQHR